MLNNNKSPLQELRLNNSRNRIFVKRDDILHPYISGNKWRKMKYNLQEMKLQKKSTLLTFGGAFSNHIAACAAAGEAYGFKTIGIIRGEKIMPLNSTLSYAKQCGMQLKFVNRMEYKRKDDAEFKKKLTAQFGDFYALPEGGTNCFALQGCGEIIKEVKEVINPDYWCVACGTGGTIAGMISEVQNDNKVIGFSALKGDFLKKDVATLLKDCQNKVYSNWRIETDYHFGGYAKWKPELIEFIKDFKQKYNIQLDPIYTAKMFFGLFDLIEKGKIEEGASIVAIHTGGLQGIEGFNQRFKQNL